MINTNGITISISTTVLFSVIGYLAVWAQDNIVTKSELEQLQQQQQIELIDFKLSVANFILSDLDMKIAAGQELNPHQRRIYDDLIINVSKLNKRKAEVWRPP